MNVYLSFGSNKGNRTQNIQNAYKLTNSNVGIIIKKSTLYETKSWGYDDSKYLNSVILTDTNLSPQELLYQIQKIEQQIGRTQKTIKNPDGTYTYSARVIDIDILFYEHQIINLPELIIPHPHIALRRFVLEPMCEIAPNFEHPILKRSVSELLSDIIEG